MKGKLLIITILTTSCMTSTPEERCQLAGLEIQDLKIIEYSTGTQESKINCIKREKLFDLSK